MFSESVYTRESVNSSLSSPLYKYILFLGCLDEVFVPKGETEEIENKEEKQKDTKKKKKKKGTIKIYLSPIHV